jgi:hypothetical protein
VVGVKDKGRVLSRKPKSDQKCEREEREREEKLEKLERWMARWARPTGTTWVESDKVEGIAGLIYARFGAERMRHAHHRDTMQASAY